jgi:ATP-dependent DNA helicase RecG
MDLNTPLHTIGRLREEEKSGLKRLGLFTVGDLLWYFPVRYSHITDTKPITEIETDSHVTIIGTLENLKIKKAWKTKTPMAEGVVTDITGSINVLWFNQPYIAKMFHEGSTVQITGKVSETKNGKSMVNPEIKKVETLPIDNHESLFFDKDKQETHFGFPVYRETRGLTSRFIYHTLEKIFGSNITETLVDPIPETIRTKYSLPTLATALIWIHMPKNKNHADAARKRFAFEEIFFIQLKRGQDRARMTREKAYNINLGSEDHARFLKRFSFTPTHAQTNAIETILEDLTKHHPMSRLLEGDVGSGKTAVAAVASLATVLSRPNGQNFGSLQVAYMAPTEILATQHFENFVHYFDNMGIQIGLITGSGCRKYPTKVASAQKPWTEISRTQLLKWVASGEIPIVIGTHALIQKSIKFKHLALAIVDEQHRFGQAQRRKLAQKDGTLPHFLSMTATPIPRTLALTLYGDLDLTLLDQMPPGRKQIITEIVQPQDRDSAYEKVKKELEQGRQVYIICPRIDEGDPEKQATLLQRSVTQEAKRLKKEVFQKYEIDILHSKMSPKKKDEVMKSFSEGHTDILVATSVVEVGVNVPNATVIVIEGAERFGLAQLHQLRGRVIRGTHQAYCYIFTESESTKTVERLKAFTQAKNGFELAELDLALRGAGELTGIKQWGVSDLGMEAIKNIKMVEAAREEARKIIAEDLELHNYPEIKKVLDNQKITELHFE